MQQETPNLKDTQKLLWELITWPEGVHDALKHRPDVVLPVTGSPTLSAADRLNIYADMYFFRIKDALKEDFPRLLKELGEDGFHNLIVDYLHAHPPRHYSLRNAGEHLAGFLSPPPRGRDRERGKLTWTPPHPNPLPMGEGELAHIARFEWALIEAFDAAEAKLLSEDDLKKIPAENWPDLLLKLQPSVQLVEHDHQIVWRQGLEVVHVHVATDEWKLLHAIHCGENFASLCAQTNAEKMSIYLRNWLSLGLLRAP